MKRCFYKESYPLPPKGEEDHALTFEECLLQSSTSYIATFLEAHPKFIHNYFEVKRIDDDFKEKERSGNLRLCPVCRK